MGVRIPPSGPNSEIDTMAVESKSTDKLKLVTEAAVNILNKNPKLADRLASVTVTWVEVDDAAVPNIDLRFYSDETETVTEHVYASDIGF